MARKVKQAFKDPSGRGKSAGVLAVRGVAYAGVVAVIGTLLLMSAGGRFQEYVPATAVVTSVGDGLQPGADVKLRGVLVGTVDSVRSEPGGAQHAVALRLKPKHAGAIPASVKARIVPSNIFGAPSVELVPQRGDTGVLATGAVIPGDNSAGALQLQTAINNLQQLIAAVEPSKLNSTLSNIKQALDGRGEQIGSMITRLNRYLGKLNPNSGEFEAVLTDTGTALQALADTAPDLLDTVDGLLPTTRTVVDKREEFVATLTGADVLLDKVDGTLRDKHDRIIRVLKGTRAVVETLAKNADEIPRSFGKLKDGVDALISVFDRESGHLKIGIAFVNAPFDHYTAADCPRYPGLDGPNCGDEVPSDGGAEESPLPEFGGTVGPVGSEQEKRQLSEILGDDIDADLGSLLLGPVLRGTTVVVPK